MPKLFVPQGQLEKWALEDQVDLRADTLFELGSDLRHPASPAVHFLSLVSGSDSLGLLNKVKTVRQLEKLGAEQMADSVIVGDAAYQVEAGYVAEVTAEVAPVAAPVAPKKPNSEEDMLAAFLLDKM